MWKQDLKPGLFSPAFVRSCPALHVPTLPFFTLKSHLPTYLLTGSMDLTVKYFPTLLQQSTHFLLV